MATLHQLFVEIDKVKEENSCNIIFHDSHKTMLHIFHLSQRRVSLASILLLCLCILNYICSSLVTFSRIFTAICSNQYKNKYFFSLFEFYILLIQLYEIFSSLRSVVGHCLQYFKCKTIVKKKKKNRNSYYK